MGSSGEPAKECEGCGEKVAILIETDDSVLLCKPCLDSSAEDFSAIERDGQRETKELREALTKYKSVRDGFGIYSAAATLASTEPEAVTCAPRPFRI